MMNLPHKLISGVSAVAIAGALVVMPGNPISVSDAVAGGKPGNEAGVRVNSPHNNASVNAMQEVGAASGKRADVAEVHFYISDFTLMRSDLVGIDDNGADGWSVDWDTTVTSSGDAAITAFGYDSSGLRVGESRPVMVKVTN